MPIHHCLGDTPPTVSKVIGHYTMVPNAFFDVLVPQLKPQQVVIACWIIRQTTGWEREWSPAIGYRQLGDRVNFDKNTVMRHVQDGLKAGWLDRQGSGTSFEYRISSFLDGRPGKQEPLNGNFTKVPHAFLETLLPNLDPFALKICCWIVRQSIGWSREWSRSISYDRLARLLGLSRSAIIRHIQSLLDHNLVERIAAKGAFQYRLSNQDKWADLPKKTLSSFPNEQSAQRMQTDIPQAYAERHPPSVCEEIPGPYAERHWDCMRRDTGSPGAKERKERHKRTATSQGSSSLSLDRKEEENERRILDPQVEASLDRLRQNVSSSQSKPSSQDGQNQPPKSAEERAARQVVIADLDLPSGAKSTLANHFPAEVLQKAMDWLGGAKNIDNPGAAFYAACRDDYEPRLSKETAVKEDQAWTREKFGHLEGASLYGCRLDIFSTGAQLIRDGTPCPEVINFGSSDFRPRLQKTMDRLLQAQKDRAWIEELLKDYPTNFPASSRIDVSKHCVTYTIGEGSQSRTGVLQYGEAEFRRSLVKLLRLPKIDDEVAIVDGGQPNTPGNAA